MILKFNEYLEKINEGLIKSYDIDFVIDKASQNLSLLNVNFDLKKLPNNSIKLTLFSFNKIYIDKVFNFLNSIFTNLLGWFPSYMFMKNLSGMKNNMNYDERYLKKNFKYLDEVSIIYESKFDEEVNIPDKLYHLSIQEYQYKILSIGICPKSKNKLSSHGDRIYVCSKLKDCLDLISKMEFYFFDKNPKINTSWMIYEITTTGLNLKLYKDPNYMDKGFYLLGNVPPTNIKIIKKENGIS
jgi:hypothetical protein